MALNISKGPKPRALGVVIYGPEGIGKTTLASKFPDPVFVDLEHGSDTMDVARIDSAENFTDVLFILAELMNEDFKTVVIDTADKLEQLATEYVCAQQNVRSIEDPGYGKGYTYLAEAMVKFLRACGDLIESGRNVVIVAHAAMRKFEQPDEMGAYDRWELKLQKKTAPLIKEWADMVLFLNYKTTVVESSTKTKKAVGGKRVMYTTHHPAWDAKNRFGLPDELPMEFDAIASIFTGTPNPVSHKDEIKKALSEAGVPEVKFVYFFRTQDPSITAETIDELDAGIIELAYKKLAKLISRLQEEENVQI